MTKIDQLKEAARTANPKQWKHENGCIVGDGHNILLGNWCTLFEMEFVGLASPDVILDLIRKYEEATKKIESMRYWLHYKCEPGNCEGDGEDCPKQVPAPPNESPEEIKK